MTARGHLDLVGTPSLIALSGNQLRLGTAGNQDVVVMRAGTANATFGSGGLSFTALAAALTINTLQGTSGQNLDIKATGGAVDIYTSPSGAPLRRVRILSSGELVQDFTSGERATFVWINTNLATPSGATAATTNIIPAGMVVEGVVVRVTTAVTGATSFHIGDGSDADRWGASIAVTLGTQTTEAAFTADPRWWATTARAITLTAVGSNFTGGAVRISVYGKRFTGPTS